MYNNVLEISENARNFISELNLSCSLAMDDGGRCLLDVINDPLLLQSFLESGSDDNSKDPQDGTSSESAVGSPQISRHTQVAIPNHNSSEHVIEPSPEQMGYSYPIDGTGLLAHSAACSISTGLGVGMSLVVASSPAGPPTYHTASPSGATIHHIPSPASQVSLHQPSPASAPRSVTPLSHAIKSPSHGPSSVHSMPPPSPLQQTRSPLPPHTPSPAPSWSPAPPVQSPVGSRSQSAMPSIAFQQSHNQLLQTSSNMAQFVQALTSQQSITQKLSLQQQQLLLHPPLPPSSQQQQTTRLSTVASPVVPTTTTAVAVSPSVVQIIPAPQSNVPLPVRTSQSSVRPIQPKLPQQILPKPTGTTTNQFVTPVVKQAGATPVTAGQRGVGVGLQPGTAGQLVIGQGQPGVFAGPQGTIVLNQIIPAAMGQSPILIQGNIGNLQGVQLTLRPPANASSGQTVTAAGTQNNATLIAALQGPTQPAQALFTQTKPPIHGQQTIVIPNNITHTGLAPQNLNLATTGIPNSTMVPSASQGQGFLARSNIILAPRVMGPNHGLQLQHIQTPQGSILALAPSQAIALPQLQTALQNTALGAPQLAPGTVPMHSVVAAGQGVISGLSLQSHQAHTALQQHHHQQQHSLFTGSAVPFTSHLDQSPHQQQMVQVAPALPPQPVATSIASSHSIVQQQHHHHHHHHVQQDEPSPKPATPPKPSKVPSVNLEELLKEHGIVPENTPPPSPDSQSPQSEEPVPSQLTTTSSISQSPQLIAALQPQHPVVTVEQLSHNHPTPPLPQLKLALAQDGSVILQPHTTITSVQQSISEDTEVPASSISSVVLSTVTTSAVSVPVVTTQPCTTHGHSALLARLNAAPAVSVPDVVTSLALTTGLDSCTTSSITTTTITTTTTTLIPLTVQSLSTRSIPITSSQVAQSVSSVSSVPNQTSSEMNLSVTQTRSNTVMIDTPSSSPAPNIQNRINPVIFGFQPLISPSHQHTSNTTQAVSQVVSTSLPGSVSTGSSQSGVSVVQQTRPVKVSQPETRVVGVADNNNGAIAPSHKVQTIPLGVPNQQMLHHKIQKQISELLAQKSLTPQQQQVLKHLLNNHSLQQNVIVQAKLSHGQGSRINQPHLQNEQEKDKPLPQPSLSNQANVITTQHQTQQQQQSQQQQDQQQTIKSVTGHNVHLVNLLKQGPVHNASLRLLAPAATSASTVCDSTTAITSLAVPSHVRVGNQILAVTQQRHPVQHQLRSLPPEQLQANQPQQTLVLRVQSSHQQQQQSSSVTLPSVIQIQGKPPVNRIVAPVSKAALLHQQLTMDQNGAVNADTKNPFSSKNDACRRLLHYHVYNSKVPSVDEIHKADQTFDMVSKQLLDKYRKMMNKYQYLLIKESMRPCPTPERVMLERMFIHEESQALKADKAAVEDGKTLDLPPPPECWLKDLNPSPDHHSREDSYHLDAPVIDSCAEAMSPKCDDDESFERSPPTLKRISIKSERFSEKDFEEPVCKKPAKLLNCNIIKTEPSVIEWCNESSLCHSPSSKLCEAELDSININKNIHARSDENFHTDNREEDIMTKIRKELNISPLENDDEADVPHVDFEPPSETNGLADFEPPIARTEESCDSTLLTTYSTSGTRTNSELKYDFDMLDSTSEWVEVYSNHADKPVTESEAAVESILSDQHNQSDLDLSGIEGLDDNLEESQVIIPNGIQDDGEGSRESELNYIGFDIPKARGCREEESLRVRGDDQNDELHAQVQSAIKSILELQSEHRSYYSDGEVELIPRIYGLEKESEDLNKQGRDTPVVDYDVSLDADMGVTSSESDAALDEAVRSILL